MEFRYAISLILNAHIPYVKEFRKDDELSQIGEEGRFFQYISETLMPLLELFERLDNDRIPFRISLVITPILCHLLNDEMLQKKYLHYIDKQIEFGKQELERTTGNENLNKLTLSYYNQIVNRKNAFIEKYEKNLLKAIDFYRRKGNVEILASCATNAFLPFISHNSESMQAQMEIPVSTYRRHFGGTTAGFWLPSLGWHSEMESYLRSYNYTYTILDTHGLLFSNPSPEKGCFYPAKTPNGTIILARDLYASQEIKKITTDDQFRNNDRDAGYELPAEMVNPFLSAEGERHRTGYKYWARTTADSYNEDRANQDIYDPQGAAEKAVIHAGAFLENTVTRLKEASKNMKEAPISINAYNASSFGHLWYEGPLFIETLFRMASEFKDLLFITPSEYIFKQNLTSFQVVNPEFSSNGANGYAETWLNVSNDWIFRHLSHAMERMTELAERFPDDTGLKERALNQAAREILLAQSSDWPALLYKQDSTEYARNQAENSLRNFTTIYEALGSNYLSTEWLTTLERKHNIFPGINYRVFRRKR